MPAVTARTVNSCKSQLGNLGINLNNAAQTHSKGSSTSCTLSGKAHKLYLFPPPFPPKDYPPAPHSLHGTGVCHWKEDIQFYQKLPTATLSFQVKHCHHVTHKQTPCSGWVHSASAEGPQTCPGAGGSWDRDSRDESWGWAPATRSSQHLWQTPRCPGDRRHGKAPVRAALQPNKSTGRALWFQWESLSTEWRSSTQEQHSSSPVLCVSLVAAAPAGFCMDFTAGSEL